MEKRLNKQELNPLLTCSVSSACKDFSPKASDMFYLNENDRRHLIWVCLVDIGNFIISRRQLLKY